MKRISTNDICKALNESRGGNWQLGRYRLEFEFICPINKQSGSKLRKIKDNVTDIKLPIEWKRFPDRASATDMIFNLDWAEVYEKSIPVAIKSKDKMQIRRVYEYTEDTRIDKTQEIDRIINNSFTMMIPKPIEKIIIKELAKQKTPDGREGKE